MYRIPIIALVALLAGCASMPQLPSEAVERAGLAEPRLESMLQVDPPAQLHEITIQRQRRMPVDAKSQQCLAQAIYWEARGEGQHGMLAVASVIYNRVEDERFPDSVCDVVYEGGESPPCQFSWWCDGKSDQPANQAMWTEVNGLAYEFLASRPEDPTEGALFYHSTAIQNPWRRNLTARIGNHIFYR